MNYSDIYAFIESTVTTALGPIPVELPNQVVDYSTSTAWARITHLPGRPTVGSLGPNGTNNRTGMTQVDVFVRLGSGPTTIPDDVVAAFTRQTASTGTSGYLYNCVAWRAESGASNSSTWWQERVLISWNTSTLI